MPPGGTKQELAPIHDTTADISSHQIGIHLFEGGGRKNTPRQNAIAKAWSKTLDLVLKPT